MVDFGGKGDLWRLERVLGRKADAQEEQSPLEGREKKKNKKKKQKTTKQNKPKNKTKQKVLYKLSCQ